MPLSSDPRVCIFIYLFFCYETMLNCSQNCWIDWNSLVRCFKQLLRTIDLILPFHWRVYNTVHQPINFYECLPDLWALSQPPYFVYGKLSLGPVPVYTCITYFTGWAPPPKKKKIPPKKSTSPAPILKLTYDQKPEPFFVVLFFFA